MYAEVAKKFTDTLLLTEKSERPGHVSKISAHMPWRRGEEGGRSPREVGERERERERKRKRRIHEL